jgi:SEL1 protein
MAVSFHKIVAERGVWGDDLLRDAEVAWSSETDRGKEMAMLKWWIAAERGSEVAQNNLAFVLDQDKSILRLTRFSPTVPSNDTARLALTQWTRSAAQRNVDALVKVGDYYYHGLGDPEDDEAARLEKAARYYQSAADTQFSALAMWNLGWMYENGVGVPQDFHLAKRHYDMALETNAEAYLPATISLIKLHLRSIWHTLMGGKNGLDLWNFDDQTGHSRQWNGGGREIDEGKHPDGSEADGVEDKSIVEDVEDDGPWYLGTAKEEYKRKLGQDTTTVQEIEDPIQWARDRRNAEQERDSDFGPEDYFEGAMRGGNRGEEEIDQFGETMILVALCLAVAVLIYVRVRLVERMRRDQEAPRANGNGQQQEQPRAQAQAFPPVPPVGNPDRDDWGLI